MVETLRERGLDWLVAAVLLGLFGVAVGGSRAAFVGSDTSGNWLFWWDGFLQNSGTEMLGAFLTFILLEVIRGRRERRYQEEADERRTKATQELVRGFIQAQELARLRAAQTPEERQPILDSMSVTGLLRGANLYEANLEGADLGRADLQGASLEFTNLTDARLYRANLTGTDLRGTNLEGANLWQANLQSARFLMVKQLRRTEKFEGATLPDGTRLPGRTMIEYAAGVPAPPWRETFEAWCEMVEMDEDDYIKPADLPPDYPNADE